MLLFCRSTGSTGKTRHKPIVMSLSLSMVQTFKFKNLLPFLPVGIPTNSRGRACDTKWVCASPPDGSFGSMALLDVALGVTKRLRSMDWIKYSTGMSFTLPMGGTSQRGWCWIRTMPCRRRSTTTCRSAGQGMRQSTLYSNTFIVLEIDFTGMWKSMGSLRTLWRISFNLESCSTSWIPLTCTTILKSRIRGKMNGRHNLLLIQYFGSLRWCLIGWNRDQRRLVVVHGL